MTAVIRRSQGYHDAHLSFARAEIVQAASERRPILDLLRQYERDVRQAEQDQRWGDNEIDA